MVGPKMLETSGKSPDQTSAIPRITCHTRVHRLHFG